MTTIETWQHRYIDTNGIRMHYVTQGEGGREGIEMRSRATARDRPYHITKRSPCSMGLGGRRDTIGMFFPIRQNRVLKSMDHRVDGLPFATGNVIERRMMEESEIGYVERAGQVVFGDMTDVGDDMKSHPGTNGADISCFDGTILLLETSCRLKGIDSSKGEQSQHEEQQKAEKA